MPFYAVCKYFDFAFFMCLQNVHTTCINMKHAIIEMNELLSLSQFTKACCNGDNGSIMYTLAPIQTYLSSPLLFVQLS